MKATNDLTTPTSGAEPRYETVPPGSRLTRVIFALIPAGVAVLLYIVNNLGMIHAMFAAPRGYLPFGLPRDMDVAQYLTWINGLQKSWLLPNYHAPWTTSPGLLVPGLFPVAILTRVFSLPAIAAFHVFNLAAYVCTAYALLFLYRTFCNTRTQAIGALLIALASVPVASLPGLAAVLGAFPHGAAVFGTSAGFIEYATVSDGFLHGLTTWPLITFGTCLLVLGIAMLARYCESHERRWLNRLAIVCFVAALIHPFEVFVLLATAAIVLLREGGATKEVVSRLLFVFIAAFVGLLPYVIAARALPWVQEVSLANRPLLTVQPARLLAAIGLPAIAALVLLVLGFPKDSQPKTLFLKTWFVVSFIVFYLPGMPFQLHTLDGLFFCIGLLLITQMRELGERMRLPRTAAWTVAVIVFAWMLLPQLTFRLHAWHDGVNVTKADKPAFDSALAPMDEPRIIAWFRQNASPNDLVLADAAEAPWMATVPMHSFASHRLFSLQETRPGDPLWQNAFYAGTLTPAAAQRFLEILGARFVVIPSGAAATRYLDHAVQRARFDAYSIYEIPGQHMRPYDDPHIVELGTGTIH